MRVRVRVRGVRRGREMGAHMQSSAYSPVCSEPSTNLKLPGPLRRPSLYKPV